MLALANARLPFGLRFLLKIGWSPNQPKSTYTRGGDEKTMKIPSSFLLFLLLLLLLILGGVVDGAQATTPVDPRHAHGDKSHSSTSKQTQTQSLSKTADSITIRPNKSAETGSAKEHAFNSFSDMTQSMPSEAVKNELARKHELPGQQTSVLTPGDAASTTVSSPSLNNATTGAAPRIETGSGMSIPQPSTGASGVFK
jgi:hypothetical protein